jgi:hypothetical protein
MPYRVSTRGDYSSPSIPSRGTVRAFGSRRCGSAYLLPRLSALGCLTSLACLGPSMPSADFCRPVRAAPATLSPVRDSRQISQGKTQNVSRVNAGFIKHTPLRMEDFAVTCPLVPGVPHLVSGSCASPRAFGLGFLQTPPRGDALALLLAFGSAITWREDFHLARSVSCLAHTTWYQPRGPGLAASAACHGWAAFISESCCN